jgi:hypothetical protein
LKSRCSTGRPKLISRPFSPPEQAGNQPSPAYNLIALGEVSLPAAGSGLAQQTVVRIFHSSATTNVGVATPYTRLAGIYLQPIGDKSSGVLPRGLLGPSVVSAGVGGAMSLDSIAGNALQFDNNLFVGGPSIPYSDLFAYYRGQLPIMGASTISLDLLGGGRKTNSNAASDPLVHSGRLFAQVGVECRPRFAFVRGL